MRALTGIGLVFALLLPSASSGQESATGRAAALSLQFAPLKFEPPPVERHLVGRDVPVFYSRDESVPLVRVFARVRGGYARFSRDWYAAATALPGLLRSGGTRSLPADSLDVLLDFYAIQASFGGGGETTFSTLDVLDKHLPIALGLWGDMLLNPAFAPEQLDVWRGKEIERIRRRLDNPTGLAFSEFNRIMYGDHPTGWEISESDLEPERFSREVLLELHGRIFCAEHLVLGVVANLPWDSLRPHLEELTKDWPPCTGDLPERRLADLRQEGGVFLIPKQLDQSTVVLAQPSDVHQADNPTYFASRIGNSILGAGGFSSRLLARVRTERGYAYSASSIWTAPLFSQGLLGAVTSTRSETTVAATQLILETIGELALEPPTEEEVRTAIDQIVNGFVFNFRDPAQVVSRRVLYEAQDIAPDWMSTFLAGIQKVTPSDVYAVFRNEVNLERMTILVVGDPALLEVALAELGSVQIWEVGPGS